MPLPGAGNAEGLLQVVRDALEELRGRDSMNLRISLDSALDRDLGFDSLARVELLVRIEHAFDVQLPDTVLESAETCRDLLAALQVAIPLTPVPPPIVKPTAVPQPQDDRTPPPNLETLVEVLAWHVERHTDVVQITLCDDASEQTISYGQLWQQARAVAGGLQRRGLQPGQTVALMLPTGAEYFYAFCGVLLAGGIPVPIYPPARLSQIEEHIRRHARILDNAGTATLITVPEIHRMARLLRMYVPALRHIETVPGLNAWQTVPQPIGATGESVALLQYTSGSTGQPKGVILTHANLLSNIRALGSLVRVNSSDVFVSWLPLYHDMGLIGAWLCTFYFGCPLVLISPSAFIARPARWLQAIHRHRGTLSAAPNFAYELCLKRITDEELANLDLSCWRVAMNGAEAVMPATLTRFQERFGNCGFQPSAMMPVYGLAECSLGLTVPPLGREPLIDSIERGPFMRTGAALPAGPRAANPLRFVTCGLPLPGHQLRVVDEMGRELPERAEGRLEFKGPSATRGYFRNPEGTARLIHGEWLDSGDRAYIAQGELYVTGRIKDIVIRAGRHVYPDELEAAVGEIEGVRKGCVAVFGTVDSTRGTERLIVLAETHARDASVQDDLRQRIMQRLVAVLGEPPDEVVLAVPHTILKTSSGKIRRAASRQLYESRRHGAQPRAVWYQMVRLGAGAIRPNLRRTRLRIGEALYAAYFWILFVHLIGAVWAISAVLPRPALAWRVSAAAARGFLRLACIPFVIVGAGRLPRATPCIIVANHASYLDGLIMIAALPERISFVAKRELERNLVSRIYLRRIGAEFVERVDARGSVADAERLVAKALAGHSFMMFPEGTFTRAPGVMPFHLGAFLIAANASLPVVPVAIRGARSLLRDGQWFPRRGPVVLNVGDPVVASPERDVFAAAVELRDSARDFIRRHCGEPDVAAP